MIHALPARAGAAAALAALVAVVVAVAACGSSSAAATPASATTAPSAASSAAGPSISPSSIATPAPASPAPPASPVSSVAPASVAPSDAPQPTLIPVPELEAMMPKSFGGVAFTSVSSAFPAGGKVGPAFQAMLDTLGLAPESRSTAKATSSDPDLVLGFVLYRLEGADPTKLLDAFTSSLVTGGVTDKVTDATVGGRAVRTFSPVAIEGHQDVQGTAYIYSSGEYIYMVLAADPTVAEKAVASWPA